MTLHAWLLTLEEWGFRIREEHIKARCWGTPSRHRVLLLWLEVALGALNALINPLADLDLLWLVLRYRDSLTSLDSITLGGDEIGSTIITTLDVVVSRHVWLLRSEIFEQVTISLVLVSEAVSKLSPIADWSNNYTLFYMHHLSATVHRVKLCPSATHLLYAATVRASNLWTLLYFTRDCGRFMLGLMATLFVLGCWRHSCHYLSLANPAAELNLLFLYVHHGLTLNLRGYLLKILVPKLHRRHLQIVVAFEKDLSLLRWGVLRCGEHNSQGCSFLSRIHVEAGATVRLLVHGVLASGSGFVQLASWLRVRLALAGQGPLLHPNLMIALTATEYLANSGACSPRVTC